LNLANEEAEDSVVEISDLSVVYTSKLGMVKALDEVSLLVGKNKLVSVVGESGSGKSTLALSIMRLLPMPAAKIVRGRIMYKGVDLVQLDDQRMLGYRGTQIAMIFQEPLSSLNPVYTVSDQVSEAIAVRESRRKPPPRRLSSNQSLRGGRYENEVIEILKLVRINDPEYVMNRYPFELSGGMRQRVMIAMALSQKPSLLIADEPTSALDVTTQAQVLKLMRRLMDEVKTSILLITHDLAVSSQVSDEIAVMYAGDIVEFANVYDLFSKPLHPYTRALLSCIPPGFKDEAKLEPIKGTIPDLLSPHEGCKFAPRCQYVDKQCPKEKPTLKHVSSSHLVACTRA
jgi:peptide/nickel transport system ATP-binding protein